MVTLKIVFVICLFLVFYTYLGYGMVLACLVKIKRLFSNGNIYDNNKALGFEPEVTFMVAAYNEEGWIKDKIENCLAFDYPKDKIHLLFVTDGSSDRTPAMIDEYPFPKDVQWSLHHKDERKGKIAAVERVMKFVKTPIVIYTDANTDVNPAAIKNIVRHYANPKVGAVAGEKRIAMQDKDAANSAGEGFYWKYESTLKKWDSEFHSVVGAAGELFSIRTELYESVPSNIVIEDFVMTLQIAMDGYKVVYEPEAYAVEGSSASVQEELKRKIRIAAGGFQAIQRLSPLLNIFKYGWLSFQYISHRVLRWTITPLALILTFITNIPLALYGESIFKWLMIGQILFYTLAFIGYLLEKKQLKMKAFFIPYYFCIMNYAVIRGFGRFIKGSQSVVWEKAKRVEA